MHIPPYMAVLNDVCGRLWHRRLLIISSSSISPYTGDAGPIRLSASINTHASVQPQAASLPRLEALNHPLRNRRRRTSCSSSQSKALPSATLACLLYLLGNSHRSWNILSVVKNLLSNACACFTHADDVRLSVLSAVRVQVLDC
jgi:hypothetical protein